MKKNYFWLLAAMLLTTACTAKAQGNEETPEPPTISLTETEQQMVDHNNDFAFKLFREVRSNSSIVISPLSITYALGMMTNGAYGQTRQEICDVLGFDDVDGINRFCRKMLTEAPALDESTKAEIANTIFINSGIGFKLNPTFADKVDTYYDADAQQRDFADGETMDVINKWCSDHTHGMIPWILDEYTFSPQAASYLINALYFKGLWTLPFKATMTEDCLFDNRERVPMMYNYDDYLYTDNDCYQALQLPYGNGAYAMTVFLPRQGVTIGSVLNELDAQNWQISGRKHETRVGLPRFETASFHSLPQVMARLGMPVAFTELADFSGVGNMGVYISNMAQKARIKVNEEGTEAAAVTEIDVALSYDPDEKTFWADRPFLYIISEQSTGAIFFIGQYTGEGQMAPEPDAISATDAVRPTDAVHDLSGRRLSGEPARGVYVTEGRKIVKR